MAGGMLRPTAVLFNGGVMKGGALRDRLLSTLRGWVERDGGTLRVLDGNDLDLAVARGAAAYGFSRRGKGVRIRGGTARSYYVGIESSMPAVPGFEPPITALCVAPFGMEEGTRVELPPQELAVVVGEPVRFRFFSSSSRRADRAGALLEGWSDDELDEVSPIEITLPAEGRHPGQMVPIRLESSVTEVGTLLIEAVPEQASAPNERWKIELSVRGELPHRVRFARFKAFASIIRVISLHCARSSSVAFQSVKWHVGAPAGMVLSKRTSKPQRPENSCAASIIPCTK
jgi:hypothetical protein